MKLEKKTEKALLMGAALLFILLLCIALALFLYPEQEEAEPTPSPTVTATAAPTLENGIFIAGKLTAPDTDTFYLHKTTLTDADKAAITALSHLRTLSLTECALTDLGFLAPLSELTTLYLSDNQIRDLSSLSSLGKLRTLYLDGNPLDDLSPLYSLTSLQTLSLQSVAVPGASVEALQIALPLCMIFDDASAGAARPLMLGGLAFTAEDTELYLSSRGISDISVLSQCPGLQVLDLSGNPLEGVGVLKQLTSLHTLNLAATGLTDSELRIVMGLRSLRWLNITGNEELSGEVLDELAALLPGCEVIHDEPVYKIKLGSETFRSDIETLSMPSARLGSIGPLRKCSRLLSVDLSHNFLSDPAPLSASTNMTSLILEDNLLLSCEGLYGLSLLQTLDLSDNAISDINALSGFMYLTWLDLSNNALSVLSPLGGCINLRYLDLRGNPVSYEEVEALRLALPGCEILSDAVPVVTETPIDDPVIVFPEETIPTPPPEVPIP